MKKDTDSMLAIYQMRRQLVKVKDNLIWKVEAQKGIGPKIGAPIYAAQSRGFTKISRRVPAVFSRRNREHWLVIME